VPELRGGVHSVACHLPQEDRTNIFQQEVLPNL
jgi:peptide/nickel transport system ATP-binding protein